MFIRYRIKRQQEQIIRSDEIWLYELCEAL